MGEVETTGTKDSAGVEGETLLALYRDMVRLRIFEERCYQVYLERKIGGFCHLYSGQEAVAVGMISQLTDEDYVIAAYRDHGHALARGMSMRACMAELYGKATGCSRGMGGSMHFFDETRRFMGGHGIVGGHVPLAVGIGWKIRYRKEKAACVCFFGDGAVNQGAVHEALNLAALYRLPVLFVCENNGYAMGTAVTRASAEEELYKRAAGYNMPSLRVNGNDLFEVREVFAERLKAAKEDYEPCFIEAVTYRYRGHSMSDPGTYRSKEEVEAYKKKDPIGMVEQKLIETGYASGAEIEKIQQEARDEVADAVAFAERSPAPTVADLEEAARLV